MTTSERRTTPTTEAERELLKILSMTAGFVSGKYARQDTWSYVVEHGRWFEPAECVDFDMLEASYCYDNSLEMALDYGLPYFEGYALGGHGLYIPIHHAWNAGADGKVVDTTWDPTGIAYLGIEFDADDVSEARAAEMTMLGWGREYR